MLARDDFDALGNGADEQLLRNRVEGVPLRDTALILYTSGTTSNPRGAMLSHEAFVRTWMVTARIWETEADDRMWSALPLFHVTALGIATWIIGKGATFYSDYAFDAARTRRDAARREDHAVLSRLPAGHRGRARAPGLRQGRPERDQDLANVALPEVLEKFQKRLPHAVQLTVYGGTEGGCVTITRRDDPLEMRLNTCGACQPGLELRVVDRDGRAARPGRARGHPVPRLQHAQRLLEGAEKTAETHPRATAG